MARTPKPAKHEGSKDALRSQSRGSRVEYVKIVKQQHIKDSKLALKELKKGIYAITLKARETTKGISGDRKSLIHQNTLDQFDKGLKVHNKKHALEVDALIKSGMKWEDFIKEMNKLNKKHKRFVVGWSDMLKRAFATLAKSNRKIEGSDYAAFQTMMDNLSAEYHKNTDFRKIIVNIQQRNIQKKDWDVICSYITKYKLRKSVSSDKDRVKYNITALLFRLLDQNQRYQAVLEYSKRTSKAAGARFAESLTMANVLNIKQYEELMKELKGKNYQLSAAHEAELKLGQEQVRKMQEYIRRKLSSPMYINGAERVLNRRTIAGGILTGIGVLGMVANYMSHFNTTKGPGKFLAGLKSPYFMFSTLVAGAGAHITGKAMTVGKYGVGLGNRIIPQPKRLTNPFGVDKGAEQKDSYFTELSDICKDHRILERWLLYEQGFDDLNGFYRKKNFDMAKIKTDALEPESTVKDKRVLIDQFIAYQEKRGNKKGAMMIKQAIRSYGKQPTQNYIVRLIGIGAKIGIPTSKSFHKIKVRGQNFTHYQLLLHRQGVKSIPRSELPETRAKAAAKKSTKTKP